MKAHQIRRELQKKRGTLFFTQSDAALLAVLEHKCGEDTHGSGWIINASRQDGSHVENIILTREIEAAWSAAK